METISLEKVHYRTIVDKLKGGALIIAPSDTVYGLLTDARNEEAVKKLISFKNRPPGKPISVFVSDLKMLKDYAKVNTHNERILNELLPGPFTIVLPSKGKVSSLLESEKKTLGLRYVDYPFVTKLVTLYGSPLTATSANLSGRRPHHKLSALLSELGNSKRSLVDLVIDAGELARNKPSTIIDMAEDKIKLLRKGDIELQNSQTMLSSSPGQTRKIAAYVLDRTKKAVKDAPIVLILKGSLGAGKTEFVKGLSERLGVNNIISPTYVVYYEYLLKNMQNNFLVHADLYNVETDEELKYLHLEKYLKKGNVVCIEWGEKAGDFARIFKKKAKTVFINISYEGLNKRKITISI